MSDTPRTDALSDKMPNRTMDEGILLDFARQLERELAEAKVSIDATNGDYITMRQRAEKAEAENAALREDKARLDWLEKNGQTLYRYGLEQPYWSVARLDLPNCTTPRAAIDAARRC